MKKFRLFIIATFALVFLFTGCKTYFDSLLESTDTQMKMKAGIDYYNRGKYRKSLDVFESMILATQGTNQEDSVQYYHAMSNYRYGDYINAEANFSKFLEVFPRSEFSEEAKFLRIKCLYESTYRWELDQVPTQKAVAALSEFMYDNPNSQYYPICKAMLDEFNERLDRKNYEAAKLYYDMEDYQASHSAFKTVLKENSNNQYREQILYYTALSSYRFAQNSIKEKQKERYMSYIDDYYNFVGEFPNSPDRKSLDGYFIRAQKFVGLKVGLDSAQLAAAQEIAASENRGVLNTDGVKNDRRGIKKAISSAKRAVQEAENKNEIAKNIDKEKITYSKSEERKIRKEAKAEAKRIYKERKAIEKALKRAEKRSKNK